MTYVTVKALARAIHELGTMSNSGDTMRLIVALYEESGLSGYTRQALEQEIDALARLDARQVLTAWRSIL